VRIANANRLDTVFVLVVFCIFAASVLLVITLGGGVYQNTHAIIQEEYDARTALSYIWSKVKNFDEAGRVYLDILQGEPALCLEELYGEYVYRTVIYLYNGWIYELFYEEGFDFFLEDGTPILPTQELSFKQRDYGMISATTTAGTIYLSLRGELNVQR